MNILPFPKVMDLTKPEDESLEWKVCVRVWLVKSKTLIWLMEAAYRELLWTARQLIVWGVRVLKM